MLVGAIICHFTETERYSVGEREQGGKSQLSSKQINLIDDVWDDWWNWIEDLIQSFLLTLKMIFPSPAENNFSYSCWKWFQELDGHCKRWDLCISMFCVARYFCTISVGGSTCLKYQWPSNFWITITFNSSQIFHAHPLRNLLFELIFGQQLPLFNWSPYIYWKWNWSDLQCPNILSETQKLRKIKGEGRVFVTYDLLWG